MSPTLATDMEIDLADQTGNIRNNCVELRVNFRQSLAKWYSIPRIQKSGPGRSVSIVGGALARASKSHALVKVIHDRGETLYAYVLVYSGTPGVQDAETAVVGS